MARLLLGRLTFLELRAALLDRALHRVPASVRTLDALQLASVAFLREHRKAVALATYDTRMAEAA